MAIKGRQSKRLLLGRWQILPMVALGILTAAPVMATPRMISYRYPNCISCHVSVQGRGLLNSYGRGIDLAQSYSQKDFTGLILGRARDANGTAEYWDGRFGNVLPDLLFTGRVNHQIDNGKTDPTLSALYRQVVFLDKRNLFWINTEIGFRDSGLNDTRVGLRQSVVGGDAVFLKKLLFEWRLENETAESGKEVAFGRDYLPLGLQIDDYSTFLLHLNRNGIYDYPLQLKYFAWTEKSLASAFLYAPSFDERSHHREYGSGLLYERYPSNNLALGVQGLGGFGEESNRLRLGAYARWGISPKWALLAGADYTHFWNVEPFGQGQQVTTYLQLFYHHYEWLISSVSANYAYSDLLFSKDHLSSFRYTLSARLNRNLSLGVTYANGDILRNLGYAQELAFHATIKF